MGQRVGWRKKGGWTGRCAGGRFLAQTARRGAGKGHLLKQTARGPEPADELGARFLVQVGDADVCAFGVEPLNSGEPWWRWYVCVRWWYVCGGGSAM